MPFPDSAAEVAALEAADAGNRTQVSLGTAPVGRLVLKFHGKAFVLERSSQPILEEICRRTGFSTVALAHPLGEDATLALVRSLYKEGFLLANRSSKQSIK
jgi:hypothetical protein